jgi:hypothetical protein
MRETKALALTGVTFFLWIAAAGAIERMKLPVFALTDNAGRTVVSTQLARPGNWLLVYVGTDCPPCESVLRSVGPEEAPSLAPRMAIVVNSTDAEAIDGLVGRYPSLAGASWYADAAEGAQALRVTTVPAVFGVRDGTIEWSVAGVLSDPTDIKTIMSNWIR